MEGEFRLEKSGFSCHEGEEDVSLVFFDSRRAQTTVKIEEYSGLRRQKIYFDELTV